MANTTENFGHGLDYAKSMVASINRLREMIDEKPEDADNSGLLCEMAEYKGNLKRELEDLAEQVWGL